MLKTRDQIKAAKERLESISHRIKAFERTADNDLHSRAMLSLLRTEQSKLQLLMNVAELRTQDGACNAIPAWHLWDGSDAIGSSLWMMRSLSDLSQADVATGLEVNQSSIARDERDSGASPKWPIANQDAQRVGRVYKHAALLGYEFVPVFVRKGGFGASSVIARLSIEAVTIRNFFGNARSDQALFAFLSRIRDLLEADSVSCYTTHPDSRSLELACAVGNQSAGRVRKRASGQDIPSLLLNEQPFLVKPLDHPILANSAFAREEGLELAYVLPFSHLGNPSILFVNWCRKMGPYSPQFEQSLPALAQLVSLAIGQERIPIARDSADDGIQVFVKAALDSLWYKLGIPRCAITYHKHEKDSLLLENGSPFVPENLGEAESLSVAAGRGVTVAAFNSKEYVYIQNIKTDPRGKGYVRLSSNLDFADMLTELAVPVMSRTEKGRCYGVLNIEAPTENAFSLDAIQDALECAERLAILQDRFGSSPVDQDL